MVTILINLLSGVLPKKHLRKVHVKVMGALQVHCLPLPLPLNLLILFLLTLAASPVFGQRDTAGIRAFTSGYDIVSISGAGWEKGVGDLVLELRSKQKEEDLSDFETLLLLKATNGSYTQIAKNEELAMNPSVLGVSGSCAVYLVDSSLFVDYNLGSSSSFSRVSIQFKKNNQGLYLFDQYTSATSHYGEEDLFARKRILANLARPLPFSEATEAAIVNSKANVIAGESAGDTRDENEGEGGGELSITAVTKKFQTNIPPDYQLIAFAVGDLNGDSLTRDALLLLQNEEDVVLRLLLETKAGAYKLGAENDQLLSPYYPTQGRPVQNIRLVIKNTYFTVEQRIATSEMDFDHRYLSFHFDRDQQRFILHRYDVEQYAGFLTEPVNVTTRRYNKDFAVIYFADIAAPPNTFIYDQQNTLLSGKVVQKKENARGRGNSQGNKRPLIVSILELPRSVSVEAPPYRKQASPAPAKVSGLAAVQLLTENRSIDLQEFLNKRVQVTGKFLRSYSESHITPVVFVVHSIAVK